MGRQLGIVTAFKGVIRKQFSHLCFSLMLPCRFFRSDIQCSVLSFLGHSLNVQSFRFRITRLQFSHFCFFVYPALSFFDQTLNVQSFRICVTLSMSSPFVFGSHAYSLVNLVFR